MFSFTDIPIPIKTPIGRPISGGFKYRVLGYNTDTPLTEVAQMYAHRKSEAIQYETALKASYAFVVRQEWDKETQSYK